MAQRCGYWTQSDCQRGERLPKTPSALMQLLNVGGDPSGCTTQIEIGKVGGIERKGAIRDLKRLPEVVLLAEAHVNELAWVSP